MYNSLVSIWSPTLVWRAVAFLRMEVWNSWCKVCLCTDLVQNLAQARTQLSCSKVQSSALRNLEHCITPSFGSPQAQPLPSLPASLRATGLKLGFYKVNTICVSSKFVFQHNLYFITVWVISQFVFHHSLYFIKTRRYGPLRGPTSSSCGGLRPMAEAFFALRAKKELIMLFWPIFGNFWCPVVTLVTFSSNL